MGKIEIYGVIASPFVRTVMIVCEHIGIPYELKELDPANKPPEFKKLNPQQTIPVISDDGFVLQESHAIIQYLMDKYAKDDSLYPKNLASRAVIHARLDFQTGTLLPKLAASLVPVIFKKEKISEEGVKTINELLSIVEEYLTRNKWVAGSHMTIADISLANVVAILLAIQIDLTEFPKTRNWFQEIRKDGIYNKIYETGMKSWRERYSL